MPYLSYACLQKTTINYRWTYMNNVIWKKSIAFVETTMHLLFFKYTSSGKPLWSIIITLHNYIIAPPLQKGSKIWNPLPGMPRSVGRHYDEVIHPVALLWRRCTSLFPNREVLWWGIAFVETTMHLLFFKYTSSGKTRVLEQWHLIIAPPC
jgi:hypothetical protein